MPKGNRDVEQAMQAIEDLLPRFTNRSIETYLRELLTWNPQLGLVSKQESPAVVARLVRQSVALWEFVTGEAVFAHANKPWRVADIGTGGGFPGLVWKLLEPRIHLTLIERRGRKAHFLERTLQRTGVSDTEVIARDVAEVAREGKLTARFDLVVMMAVATPGALGHSLEVLLRPGGYLASVRPTTQQLIEQRAGDSLTLTTRANTETGTFVLYQKPR